MNKTYILTALGVLGSPLFTTNANADLFKCVACTNKPANSSYTSSGNGTSNCSWSCNSGYTQNGSLCCASKPANSSYSSGSCSWSCDSGTVAHNSKCVKLSDLKESDFTQVTSASAGNCATGSLSSGIYMVKLRAGKGGKGYGNSTEPTQYSASGVVFQLTQDDTYSLCAGKNGTDGTSKTASTGGDPSYFALKDSQKFVELQGSEGTPATKCDSIYGSWCESTPHSLPTSYAKCKGYTNSDRICCYNLIGTPENISICEVYNTTFAKGGGCADILFGGGCSVSLGLSQLDLKIYARAKEYFKTNASMAFKLSTTISVQNCDGPCAILYKLK